MRRVHGGSECHGGLTLYDRIEDRHKEEERGDATWRVDSWPPLSQKGLNPIIDVEDLSMMQMRLDNGVLASYQQCHYTPDGWRNYTIIGTEGRIENFGDGSDDTVIRLWNRRVDYRAEGDEQFPCPASSGGHGGADPLIVAEFVRFVREGGKTRTSPIAARNSVAAGYQATLSIRKGGCPMTIPPVPDELRAYFDRGQSS